MLLISRGRSHFIGVVCPCCDRFLTIIVLLGFMKVTLIFGHPIGLVQVVCWGKTRCWGILICYCKQFLGMSLRRVNFSRINFQSKWCRKFCGQRFCFALGMMCLFGIIPLWVFLLQPRRMTVFVIVNLNIHLCVGCGTGKYHWRSSFSFGGC